MVSLGKLPKTWEELETLVDNHSQNLNWKSSIVDLLKLLGVDSGLNNRKALAKELNCPEKTMKDIFLMNAWLHKTILQMCVNQTQSEQVQYEQTQSEQNVNLIKEVL